MKNKFFTCVLLLCALLLTGTKGVAEVSAQLRDQVMKQAASMALPATWVHEGLGSTGFLDDPKTKEIVERSPAAYALAWAALQAEDKQPGAAVQLLQYVAQDIAAHHADAIRHEPAFGAHFRVFPQDKPVPAPTPVRFAFERSVEARPDVAQRLPNGAQAMIAPLAKYAYAYPGGMQRMMVDVLHIAPTDAMSIERSSPDAGRALFTAIERSPVPPPTEVHLKETLAALLLHGGEAIRYEDAVRQFGRDVTPVANSPPGKPVVTMREEPKHSVSPTEQHEKEEIAMLAGQLVASLKQNPDRENRSGTAQSSPPIPLPSGPPPGFSNKPSFNERVGQLHSRGVERLPSLPDFTMMRSIGGGLGGGGIVMGGAVAATFEGQPIGVSFRPLERSSSVVAVVAMSDGRVLFSPPVRPDILLAAYRIGFGYPARGVARIRSSGTGGAVLISLLAREKTPIYVSEFLVHPAISDLQIGRDLIIADAAEFLFSEELATRLGKVQNIDVPSGAVELTVDQWRAAMEARAFGGWYRYVERSLRISLQQDALIVTAVNEPDRNTLFELVRPAEPENDTPLRKERSVVIRGATDALTEFRALNDLLRVSAIMRWAQDSGASWLGGLPQSPSLPDVQSIVKTAHSATFDSRGIVEIELARVGELAKVLPLGLPSGKKSDAQRLNEAYAHDAAQALLRDELRSRGYSSEVEEQAILRLQLSKSNGLSSTDRVLLEMMQRELPPSEYEPLKNRCDKGFCPVYFEAVKRQPWIKTVAATWGKTISWLE